MPDLVTRERALRNLNNLAASAAENALIDALIAAVSRAIERHCSRSFALEQFDDLVDGVDCGCLLLRHFPIYSVERVAYAPTTVLTVRNSSMQRAAVKITAEGVELTRVSSGVTTRSTVTFAANPTLGQVKDAVSALGNGWLASLSSTDYVNLASADLRAPQGAVNARDQEAPLKLHVMELNEYDIDAARGGLLRGGSGDGLCEEIAPLWAGGPQYWRIVYTAGFATVPDDVQEACCQWIAALFWQSKRDPGLTQEAIPGSVSRSVHHGMPPSVRAMLAPYRVIRI
jgi:hypothetical protein